MTKKWVYLFREGNASMRDLLGGKGAGVAEMTRTGVPVPPGFTITTEACNAYYENGQQFPEGMWEQVLEGLKDIEAQTGKRFGDPSNPLLVSVRSGAKFSMPGMMDTVLNLGLNQQTREGLARLTNNPRFAADAYRRFVQLFGKIVLGVDGDRFEHEMDEAKGHGQRQDTDLTTEELLALAEKFKAIIKEDVGVDFPEDPFEQLRAAIAAVFRSWNGRRAVDYRRVNKIPDNLGTAVNVQAMVFGNMGNDSATGVAFTRNPSTGEPEIFGEYLVNAQGEDVVAGIRTPQPISKLAQEMPEVYEQFHQIAKQLERHYKDMQDVEFTIERGKLWMLQTRTGKRTGAAAVKIAVDMVNEGLIDRATAVQRVDPHALDQLLHPMIDPAARKDAHPLTVGLPASPGAASGKVVFDPDEAEELAKTGEKVILVRVETAPEDFHGMVAAQAILTARGGMTSHAAVVARGMGKPCVAGAGDLRISYADQLMTVNGTTIRKGDWITLDGGSGEVFAGKMPTVEPELSGDFATLMSWADEFRKLGVRANADIPRDARVARQFGAEGIGLCRTEHMFFEGDRIDAMREMILADTVEERRAALAKIEPLQQGDFEGLFREMAGLPVTIRTLDPPLHEFLPHDDEEIEALANKLGVDPRKVKARVESLREANPMLGFRGCRLGILYPEITEMQARAIFKAAVKVKAEGIDVHPEVMIPLVGHVSELKLQEEIVRRVAAEVFAEAGIEVPYLVGTMIELPRAALVADEIAQVAEFFSFGTNDLTQTTLGLSRDDSGRFLPIYVEKKLIPDDPFQTIDQRGVGQLVQIGTERGRSTRPDLKVGVCGEHGGDPASVEFFHRVGLNYVSCSPYRVPIARLAAAQAALGEAKRDK
ncbi:MAG TPA: pyruvate, phosphate dikinase [Chloroflexus aurantiacus]|jgi:pyruvate,orthophosphate dikinase|uniref:Pyruvate, phosphate dikinase n=1 Tax=Chloroflexus aurantiacus (strain ATCC 29366 / DSM 635 / J-10-fl) TaxID=324602 RepID=A9WG08_CHLAA|nr:MULTISPECIES: pyruvate, phosphate dikinase [Chloroflexus]ABY36162.1 pyruvate, phosphate dikinase [Chloroflexus aurantiacus J-10-fl]RMG51139.1 MAG: pyruvate, phosphate dikinase [Chloroflexota bacterium]HBW69393.1 pyruvate, phosphate dikinase [Chloroflexus aurantiacus]